MQVYNSVKALVLSTRETSALLPHPSCQKCFGEHGILNKQACLSLSLLRQPRLYLSLPSHFGASLAAQW